MCGGAPPHASTGGPRRPDKVRTLAADLSQLFAAALAQHRAGDLQSAQQAYRDILESHPEQPDALNLLAMVAMEEGRYASAVELLRRATTVAGEVAQFHCHLGNALQGSGDPDAAARAYRRAVSLQPDHLEALSNLGFVLTRLGQWPEAVTCLEKALAIDPEYFFALHNLGDALSRQGELEAAADAYRRAIAVAPEPAELHFKLAALLREQGRFAQAVDHLWAAIDGGDRNWVAHRLLGSLLSVSTPRTYDRQLEQRVLAFLHNPGVDPGDVAEFATALLKLKYADDRHWRARPNHAFVVNTLLSDALVRALLTRTVLRDGELEQLFTAARRALLCSPLEAVERVVPGVSALAQQCFSNEYVFALTDDERLRLDGLRAELESKADWNAVPDASTQLSLLLYSTYAPLGELSIAPRLAEFAITSWNEALRPLVQRTLLERMVEGTLEAQIPAVGVVENPVSKAVKAQYEANPYPRWLTPAYRTPGNLHGILKGMFPDFEPPAVLRDRIRVLVVGCGTGHHPISIALRYTNADVLATDISRRSLAYGVRMARELGIENVRFVENDLLNLSELDGDFHVIECVGVLHHMHSIAEGIEALLGKLRPDGLLKLGLYSERAREPVAQARARVAELGLTPTADDIRRIRSMALRAPEHDPLRRILDFGDFYTLSNCRDLLFHVHEQNVTLAGIGSLLADARLRFVGFETVDPALAATYRRLHPADGAMRDLSRWEAVEEELPAAFAALYQFWCARCAAPIGV